MKREKARENGALSAWCANAARYIRFGSERRQVYRELYGHMEDRFEALISSGMKPEDAETLTVRAMGDSDEVGRELARVHRPFWGYVLWATRVLLILAFIYTALAVRDSDLRYQLKDDSKYWNKYPWTEESTETVYPKCEDKSDGYTVNVARAAATPVGDV